MRITFLPLLVCSALLARSDIVECENGDRYNGRVLLVDEHNVKLQNDITGILSIPRAKVSTITFGAPRPARSTPAANAAKTNLLSLSRPVEFDSSAIEQVQNQFLGDATPEANQMFQEMVRGLMSGKLDLGDVRGKAQSTLDQLKELQKDLGDDESAALLGSYASILENFLKQAPASKPKAEPPAEATNDEKSE